MSSSAVLWERGGGEVGGRDGRRDKVESGGVRKVEERGVGKRYNFKSPENGICCNCKGRWSGTVEDALCIEGCFV